MAKTKGRGLLNRIAANILRGRLKSIVGGKITFVEDGQHRVFGTSDGLEAEIRVHNPNFYRKSLLGGGVGFAEAFIHGWWSTDDLTALLRIFVRDINLSNEFEKGFALLARKLLGLYHWRNKNTRTGSRQNIFEHYDLGNDFFSLFLDETLTYSCGIFNTPETSLKEASIAKLERMCEMVSIEKNDHVLEIGCGWGSFAIHAAEKYGCRVSATTISKEQYNLARERVRRRGLDDRVKILFKDYRELEGTYDKLVSIEMIEAVGHDFLGDFFTKCESLLAEDGAMALQGITMSEDFYEEYLRSADFIQRYIFPGSCCPALSAIKNAATAATDLELARTENIGSHYATTLREWGIRFSENIEKIRSMGYSEEFIRTWLYYFSYCEAGFAEDYLGNVQMVLQKPLFGKSPAQEYARKELSKA
ncbi:MAG: cyclopropane-fatty-acyl-phospholipid synthase family protein [Planctomycetota bacterium]|nr:cyclopropane-fatty-acyl-phospholipid synthase family protein [Planctomycetota bacterium]